MDKKRDIKFFQKYNKAIIFIFSVILNLILLKILANNYEFFYATNDDIAMLKFANGEYGGEPSPYLVYILYPLGYLISSLYKFKIEIPWMALFHIFMIEVTLVIMLYKVLINIKKRYSRVMAVIIYLAVFVTLIKPNIVKVQFTVTSAIISCCILIILSFINKVDSKKILIADGVICALLSILGISMRKNIFLLFIPIYIIILFTYWCKKNISIKRAVAFIAIILLFSGGSYVFDLYKVNTLDGYKEFEDFSTSRSEIFDYGKVPEYEENEEFYSELGITKAGVEMIKSYSFDIGPELSNEAMKKIAEKSVEERYKVYFIDRFIASWNFAKMLKSFNFFIATAVICVIISFIFYKKGAEFIGLGFAGFYNILAMLYLITQGRIKDRVNISLTLSMAVLLFICVTKLIDNCRLKDGITEIVKDNIIGKLYVLGTLSLAALFLVNLISIRGADKDTASDYSVLYNRELELRDYMKEHSDNYYYIEASTEFAEYEGMITKTDTRINNFSSLGGWSCRSPQYYDKIAKYGITNAIDALVNKSNVYFVAFKYPQYMEDYIKETYPDKKFNVVEELNFEGYKYYIYKVG